jgi:hypothetical protein
MRSAAVALAVLLALLPSAAMPSNAPNVTSWLADFTQLQTELSEDYANLEWVAADRRVDLPKLVAVTQEQLRNASSDDEAREDIELFLAAFGDGHLEVDWPNVYQPGGAPAKLPPLCARLGYSDSPPHAGIAFDKAGPYQSLSTPGSRYFPTGLLWLSEGRVAVLRLAEFSAQPYPELCEQARVAMGLSENSACDDTCADAIQLRAENALTSELEQSLAVLLTVGHLRTLVVDLTHNGGGSDWLEPAARELTQKRLRSPALGLVKSDHWERLLAERLKSVQAGLPASTGATRDLLMDAQRIYTNALAAAHDRCKRLGYFAGMPVGCSQIVRGTLFTSGTLAYAAPGSLPNVPSSEFLFAPSRFTYREGSWNGSLIVLVDRNTASAAERFAAMLQDAGAATIVGVPTDGAGCGFTNGGIPAVLDHSGASIRMPDCVQYRADGSDAVAGITPNVLVPWRDNDSAYQVVTRAVDVLQTLQNLPRTRTSVAPGIPGSASPSASGQSISAMKL